MEACFSWRLLSKCILLAWVEWHINIRRPTVLAHSNYSREDNFLNVVRSDSPDSAESALNDVCLKLRSGGHDEEGDEDAPRVDAGEHLAADLLRNLEGLMRK